MVLNTYYRVAVKCSQCGKFNIFNWGLFELREEKNYTCACCQNMVKMCIINGELNIEVSCIACDNIHGYRIKIGDILNKPISILSCPQTGLEILFIGNEKYVDDIVNGYMEDMFQLLRHLGVLEEKQSKIVK